MALGRIRRQFNVHRRGVLAILGGTAAGQIVALAAAPILSRIYSPTDFGIFATCTAIIVTIGTVAAGRYELAVPLPSKEKHAQSLVFLGLTSACLVGIAGTAVVALAGTEIATRFGQARLMPWLWAVPISATAMGCSLVLSQLAIRHGRFKSIGRRNVLQQVTMVVGQIAGGLGGLKPGGLVIGFGFSYLASAASLLIGSGLRAADARQGRKFQDLRAVARRYWKFPAISGPSGLLNVLGLQLPVVLLAYWYGAHVAGWMSLTQRVLALPVTLIGTAVGQVYLSRLAVAIRGDVVAAARMFDRASRNLGGAACLALIALLALGPWVFPLVFGSQWANSGLYAQAMSVSLACQLVAAPLSQTLIVLERQRLQLAWDLSRVVSVATTLYIAHVAEWAPLAAVWAIGTVLAITYVASWLLCRRAIHTAPRNVSIQGRTGSAD